MSAKIMYDYIEGYCPLLHYRCLTPVTAPQIAKIKGTANTLSMLRRFR